MHKRQLFQWNSSQPSAVFQRRKFAWKTALITYTVKLVVQVGHCVEILQETMFQQYQIPVNFSEKQTVIYAWTALFPNLVTYSRSNMFRWGESFVVKKLTTLALPTFLIAITVGWQFSTTRLQKHSTPYVANSAELMPSFP